MGHLPFLNAFMNEITRICLYGISIYSWLYDNWWLISIGWCNDDVPFSNNPSPQPILFQLYGNHLSPLGLIMLTWWRLQMVTYSAFSFPTCSYAMINRWYIFLWRTPTLWPNQLYCVAGSTTRHLLLTKVRALPLQLSQMSSTLFGSCRLAWLVFSLQYCQTLCLQPDDT